MPRLPLSDGSATAPQYDANAQRYTLMIVRFQQKGYCGVDWGWQELCGGIQLNGSTYHWIHEDGDQREADEKTVLGTATLH